MRKHFLQSGGAGRDSGRPKREPIVNIPPLILGLVLLCCLAYFLPAYLLSAEKAESFYAFFGFVPVLFLHNHDIMTQISAVSYSFLHGNFAHLALNMLWLVIFGAPLANRLGNIFFILFWFFTAFIAAMVYCAMNFDSDAPVIGASGAISGMMGASARYNFQAVGGSYLPGAVLSAREAITSRAVLIVLGSFIALNFLTAADQSVIGFVNDGANIAWEAHIGGLLAGFLAIGFFDAWTHNFKR